MPGFGPSEASRRRRNIGGTPAPAPAPVLGALSLAVPAVAENAPPGGTVSTILGRTAGSTLSLTDNAGGRFAISGANLLAGLTGTDFETATSHSITIRETLAGATNTPRDTVLAVAVTNVFEAASLGVLSLSATSYTTGTPSSGTVTGATPGSTIVASGLPTGLTVNGAARTWAWDGTGSAGSTTITLTETLADSANSPRASTVGVTVAASGSAALRAATGTFTGTGAAQDVSLPFKPDLVFVWADAQPLVWRARTAWHGRSQRFHTASSSYVLGASVGDYPWMPFNSSKFSVTSGYSVAARSYRYLALKTNDTATLEEITIVGNALTGRTVDFTSRRSKLIIGKRDSSRSAVFTTDGAVPQRADVADGPLVDGVAVTNTGMTLSNSVWVNENNNIALGEAIEYLSLIEADGVKITRRTGTGGATTLTGMGSAVIIVPAGTTPPKGQAVIDGRNGSCFDGVAPTEPVSLAAGTLSLPATYNDPAREYIVLSFADTASPDVDATLEPTATQIGHVSTFAQLSAGLALSGAASFEYYGRPLGYTDGSLFYPLLMFGDGTDGGTTGMNGGAYLYTTDPDANGWNGATLRIIHSQYLATKRTAPHASINYYNFNTGIIIGLQDIVHLVVTHNGTGKWRVFLHGKLVKEYNVNLNQATYGNRLNGGGGTSLPVYANGTPTRQRRGDLYRAQVWNAALSDAEAKSLFANAQSGSAWGGTAPLAGWDFRGAIPGGTSGATLGAKRTPDAFYWYPGTESTSQGVPSYSGSDVRVTTAAGDANGRVYTRLGSGTFTVQSELEYGLASRIICRTHTDTLGLTGGTVVFDLTGTGSISRSDSVTAVDANLFYVGVTTAGQHFTIKPTTTITRTA